MLPENDSTTAGRFPLYVAFPRAEYYQPVRLPVSHHEVLALRGLFPVIPPSAGTRPALPCSQGAPGMHAVGTNPGSLRTSLANAESGILSSPQRDKIDDFDHVRFRG